MREVLTPPREVSTSHPSILSTFKPLLTSVLPCVAHTASHNPLGVDRPAVQAADRN
jgi:hypothetical protein